MISCVNDVLKSLLDDILQSQDDGLLAGGRVHLVKIEKDVLWQETLLICLEGFKWILKWKEKITPVKPKPDMWDPQMIQKEAFSEGNALRST